MTPEQVLSIKPRMLTQKQRDSYFENGYILLEKLLPDSWIERLRATTEEMVDNSSYVAKSDEVWDLDRAHTPDKPRLRRLSSMNDHHPVYWEYSSSKDSPLPDAIADLVGPDVKFHQSKLNFKWSQGGDELSGIKTFRFGRTRTTAPARLALISTTAPRIRVRSGYCQGAIMGQSWTSTTIRISGSDA